MTKPASKLLLIFCVLSLIPVAALAEVKCRDIDENHEAYSAVKAALPIIDGCNFEGNKLINRYLMAGVIEGLIKEFGIKIPEKEKELKFEDVWKRHPRREAILMSINAGILRGFKGKFHGDKLVNRYQMAVILSKLLELIKGSKAPDDRKNLKKMFRDVGRTHWASTSIHHVVSEGFLKGEEGTFDGSKLITRYKMAEIIYKLLLKK